MRERDDRRVLLVAPQPFYEDRGTPIAVRHLIEALSELGYGTKVHMQLPHAPVGSTRT